MALLVLWCLVLLAAAVPDLCPSVLGLRASPPDVWVAVVVYIAMRARGYRAVGWGILLGLVRDALSLDPLGTHAFVLGCVAYLFCEGQRSRGRVDVASAVLAAFAGTILAGWLYIVRTLPVGSEGLGWADVVAVFPTALWTALLAVGLYSLLDRFKLLDELRGRPRGLPA